jgi:hypothetical protein
MAYTTAKEKHAAVWAAIEAERVALLWLETAKRAERLRRLEAERAERLRQVEAKRAEQLRREADRIDMQIAAKARKRYEARSRAVSPVSRPRLPMWYGR